MSRRRNPADYRFDGGECYPIECGLEHLLEKARQEFDHRCDEAIAALDHLQLDDQAEEDYLPRWRNDHELFIRSVVDAAKRSLDHAVQAQDQTTFESYQNAAIVLLGWVDQHLNQGRLLFSRHPPESSSQRIAELSDYISYAQTTSATAFEAFLANRPHHPKLLEAAWLIAQDPNSNRDDDEYLLGLIIDRIAQGSPPPGS